MGKGAAIFEYAIGILLMDAMLPIWDFHTIALTHVSARLRLCHKGYILASRFGGYFQAATTRSV